MELSNNIVNSNGSENLCERLVWRQSNTRRSLGKGSSVGISQFLFQGMNLLMQFLYFSRLTWLSTATTTTSS